MKNPITLLKQSFLTRIILVLFAISSIGVVVGVYFISSLTLSRLLEIEEKYEQRITSEYAGRIGQLVEQITNIFHQIYVNDYQGYSLESMLSGTSSKPLSAQNKKLRIYEKLQIMNQNYPFTSGVALVDYRKEELYYYSREPGRGAKQNFNYKSADSLQSLGRNENPVTIIPPYYPEYLAFQGGFNQQKVFSVCLNIYDAQRTLFKDPLGTLIINIEPDLFHEFIDKTDDSFGGRLIVTEKTGDRIIFDSSSVENVNGTEVFVLDDFDTNRFVVTEPALEADYFRLYGIFDKDSVLRVYSDSRKAMYRVLILTIAFLLAASILLSRLTGMRFRPLMKQMAYVREGILDNRIQVRKKDEIGNVESLFNDMCERLSDYIQQVYLSKLRYRTANLRILQQQMNPHFMYNTLQSIHINALVNNDRETARMIHLLGEIFRWALDDSTTEVSISDELFHLKTYIELQAIRFENTIELDDQIPADLKKFRIVKLSLQPLVENSIQHGFAETDGGRITISAEMLDEHIQLTISDNGCGMNDDELEAVNLKLSSSDQDEIKASDDGSHIGLMNVHSRLKMFYGTGDIPAENIGITEVGNGELAGFMLKLTIPVRN